MDTCIRSCLTITTPKQYKDIYLMNSKKCGGRVITYDLLELLEERNASMNELES